MLLGDLYGQLCDRGLIKTHVRQYLQPLCTRSPDLDWKTLELTELPEYLDLIRSKTGEENFAPGTVQQIQKALNGLVMDGVDHRLLRLPHGWSMTVRSHGHRFLHFESRPQRDFIEPPVAVPIESMQPVSASSLPERSHRMRPRGSAPLRPAPLPKSSATKAASVELPLSEYQSIAEILALLKRAKAINAGELTVSSEKEKCIDWKMTEERCIKALQLKQLQLERVLARSMRLNADVQSALSM